MSRPMVRILVDRFFGALIAVSVMLAAVPVLVLLLFVVIKGLPGLLTPGFFTDPPFPQGVPGGGVFNAIIGTLVIVGIGSLLAVPIGSLIGIFLSEYGRNQLGDAVRFISDVLTGLPSIAFGIFGYTVVVLTTHHFSAISASIALAVLMLPVILRATESALVLVPQSLREAGLALGAPRWRVTLEIVVPAALGGIVTGGFSRWPEPPVRRRRCSSRRLVTISSRRILFSRWERWPSPSSGMRWSLTPTCRTRPGRPPCYWSCSSRRRTSWPGFTSAGFSAKPAQWDN